jgi:hypothetical protein
MKSSVSVCPVPTEQQPINEFQALQESWFFRWATLDLWAYLKPLIILWTLSWMVAAPVAAVSFPVSKHLLKFLLSGAIGASVLPILALVHLWLGWRYVCDRLSQAEIFYEESGWYDGQTWTKPEDVLQRDRLVVTYQIRPLLKRLHQTFGVLAALFLVSGLAWSIL